MRTATTVDGTSFWAAGSADGVLYLPFGSLTGGSTVLATPANVRACAIAASQLYCTSATSPYAAVFTVGTGLPTVAGQSATVLPGMTTTLASPYAFAFFDRSGSVSGLDTIYVADDRSTLSGGGLQKWTFDGSTWTLTKTFTSGLTSGLRGVTGFVQGANVVLVATDAASSANRLLRLVDDGSADPAFVVLATAPVNTAYRGVALAPVP